MFARFDDAEDCDSIAASRPRYFYSCCHCRANARIRAPLLPLAVKGRAGQWGAREHTRVSCCANTSEFFSPSRRLFSSSFSSLILFTAYVIQCACNRAAEPPDFSFSLRVLPLSFIARALLQRTNILISLRASRIINSPDLRVSSPARRTLFCTYCALVLNFRTTKFRNRT
jgi:hypothetical protein